MDICGSDGIIGGGNAAGSYSKSPVLSASAREHIAPHAQWNNGSHAQHGNWNWHVNTKGNGSFRRMNASSGITAQKQHLQIMNGDLVNQVIHLI